MQKLLQTLGLSIGDFFASAEFAQFRGRLVRAHVRRTGILVLHFARLRDTNTLEQPLVGFVLGHVPHSR